MTKEFNWYTHPCGIRCVHRQTRSQVAYIGMSINSGTRDELSHHHGVAHLTEHLLFKGTTRRSAFHISNRLESRGGDLNAYTSKEETVLHATCLKTDYRKALELLIDMTFNSIYAQKEINAEREIIYDEINSYKDSPAELIFDDFEELIFKTSSLGRNILGDKKQLSKLTQKDILEYTSKNFCTNQIVISSSANITFERFTELCNSLLENIKPTENTLERIAPVRQSQFDITRNKRTHQQHTIIGGLAPDLQSTTRIPLALMCNILGGPFSLSLLNQALREKHSLTYNVESSYTPYCDSGIFSIYYGCEQEKHAKATEILHQVLTSLRTVALSSGKFHRYKTQFLGQLIISNDNQESLMHSIAKSLLVFGDFESTEALYKKIDSITPKDILEIAALVLNPQNLNTLTYR